MSHRYPLGLPGASSVYCVTHCCVSTERLSVFPVGAALVGGEDVDNLEPCTCIGANERALRMTTLMNR